MSDFYPMLPLRSVNTNSKVKYGRSSKSKLMATTELSECVKPVSSLSALVADEADLYDEWCDPKKPHVLRFEEIAAAAYRIKYGVEKTPCTVRIGHVWHVS